MIDFQKGTSGSTKTAGQIPADYTQGQGAVATGTVADEAAEASLTAYPGGVVDRVVELSNGDYEVHNIGVNSPRTMFSSTTTSRSSAPATSRRGRVAPAALPEPLRSGQETLRRTRSCVTVADLEDGSHAAWRL